MELGFKPCQTLKPILLSTIAHCILETEKALVIGYSIWLSTGMLQVPKMEGDFALLSLEDGQKAGLIPTHK